MNEQSLAIAGQSQMQLSLQRGEFSRARQTLVKWAKLGQERNKLSGVNLTSLNDFQNPQQNRGFH